MHPSHLLCKSGKGFETRGLAVSERKKEIEILRLRESLCHPSPTALDLPHLLTDVWAAKPVPTDEDKRVICYPHQSTKDYKDCLIPSLTTGPPSLVSSLLTGSSSPVGNSRHQRSFAWRCQRLNLLPLNLGSLPGIKLPYIRPLVHFGQRQQLPRVWDKERHFPALSIGGGGD